MHLERLEDRIALSAVNEAYAGDSKESAQYLTGDDNFQISGQITANDLDFYAISAAKDGQIKISVAAVPLKFKMTPYLDVVAVADASSGYSSWGWWITTEHNYDPHYGVWGPTWNHLEGPGTTNYSSSTSIPDGSSSNSTITGSIAVNATEVAWNIEAAVSGNIGDPISPAVETDASAYASAKFGVGYSSNYSGVVNKSWGNQAYGTFGVSGGGGYSLGYSYQAFEPKSDSTQATWKFTPDPFLPHAALFDPHGNLVVMTTGDLTFQATENGIWYVAVSRNQSFEPTTNETRNYFRPYELAVSAEADLQIHAHTDIDNHVMVVDYNVWGYIGRNASLDLYWADHDGVRHGSPINSTPMSLPLSQGLANGSLPIPINLLTSPPVWAEKVMFVAADPLDPTKKVKEVTTINNFATLELIGKPTVELLLPEPAAIMKESYRVVAVITNTSLIDEEFAIRLTTDLDLDNAPPLYSHTANVDGIDPFSGKWLLNRNAKVDSLSRDFVVLDVVTDRWEWIPIEPPTFAFVSTASSIGSKIAKALAEALKSGLGTAVDVIKLGQKIIDLRTSIGGASTIDKRPFHDVAYRVDVSSVLHGTTALPDEDIERIVVSPVRQSALNDFESKWGAAKTSYSLALTLLTAGLKAGMPGGALSIASAELFLSSAVQLTRMAIAAYRQAYDPPDPNYHELVLVQPVDESQFADLQPGLLRNSSITNAWTTAFRNAEAVSRDRADGARLAGDSEWEGRQLLAASGFASQAALSEAKAAMLLAQMQPYLSASDTGITAEMLSDIDTNGFANEMIVALRQAGLSDTDIEDLRQEFLVAGANPKQVEELATFSREAVLNSTVRAVEDLKQAIQIRTEVRGQPISYIPFALFNDLTSTRSRIVQALDGGMRSGTILASITTLIATIRATIDQTNNFRDLEGLLNDAYLCLIKFQLADPTPAGISATINTLEINAAIDATSASALRDTLLGASTSLAAGDWATTIAKLKQFVSDIKSTYVGSMPVDNAVSLINYGAFVSEVMEYGVPKVTPIANNDYVTTTNDGPIVINVLRNDSHPTGGPLQILQALQPSHGSVAIDAGAPDTTSDDRLVYTPEVGFLGQVAISYIVARVGDLGASVATVWLDVAGWLNLQATTHGVLYGNSRHVFLFDAAVGDTLTLEDQTIGNNVRWHLQDSSGQVLESDVLAPFWREVLLPRSGRYQLTLESGDGSNDQPYALEAELITSSTIEDLALGQSVVATLNEGEQCAYKISVQAGDALKFDSIREDATEATVAVIGPAGIIYQGSANWDSELQSISVGGEYTIICRNVSAGPVDIGFRIVSANQSPLLHLGDKVPLLFETGHETAFFVLNLLETSFAKIGPLTDILGAVSWELYDLNAQAAPLGSNDHMLLNMLPAGRYLVSISAYGNGPLDFVMQCAEAERTVKEMDLDAVVSDEIGALCINEYRFNGRVGAMVLFDSIVTRSWSDSSASVYLVDPNGGVRFIGTDANDSSAIVLASAGEYRLEFVNQTPNPVAAKFRIADFATAPSITPISNRISGAIGNPEQTVLYAFNANANQSLSIVDEVASGSGVLSGSWVLYGPNGDVVSYGYFGGWGEQSVIVPFSGMYGLVLTTWQPNANYSIRVNGLTAQAIATSISLVGVPQATTGGQLVQFVATIQSTPIANAGTVVFYDGGMAISGDISVLNGVAVFSTSSITSLGNHPITAVYSGDPASGLLGSTSTVFVATVQPAPLVTSIEINGGDVYAINAYGIKVAGLAGNNSIIEQLFVTFDIGVTLGDGAFTLDAGPVAVNIPGGVNPVPVGTNVVGIIAEPDPSSQDGNGGYKSYRLRFSGSSAYLNSFDNSATGNGGSGNLFTTLKDGFYKLNVIGANVHAGDSVTGTAMAGNAVRSFWTMFASVAADDRSISVSPGDTASTVSVNSSLIGFAITNGDGYGAGNLADYNANFDWNLDGDIGDDLIEFAKRFGAEWAF